MSDDIDDDALLSRGSFNALGTSLDDVIDSFRIDTETKTEARRKAAAEGMNLTEWIRTQIQGAVWGSEFVANVHAQRIRRVLGNDGTKVR